METALVEQPKGSRWDALKYALGIESRSSPENPSTSLSNPAAWLTEALGGAPTHSGVVVSERTALQYAAAFACINVLSKDIAQLPVFVYRRDGDERSAAREHSVWRLLHDRPNPMMTPFSFKQALQAHACSWGNGYAEIEYARNGTPINLWPLLPDRTKVVVRNGQKWFVTRVREEDGSERDVPLASERVLHVPGLGFDGITGYSVIRLARNAIGTGMAAEEFSARLFLNGASPRIALKTPNKLTPEARVNLKMSWDAAYAGLSNAHRTAVLEEGLTVDKIGLPAKDQQLIEASDFSIGQMARFFDIPLMRLHSTTPITSWGTGLEQWQRAYLIHTLGPWLVQWEESCNWSLLNDTDRPTHFVEFLREALLQGDMAAQAQYFTALFNVGGISPNQIARKLNMPAGGKEGDEKFIPLNMVPLSMAGELARREPGPPPSDNPKNDDEPDPPRAAERASPKVGLRQQRAAQSRHRMQNSYIRVYEQVAGRVVTKQVERTRRAAERLEKDGNVAAFTHWVREFFEKERPVMQDAFLPITLALGELVADDVLREIGSHADFSREVDRFARAYVESMSIRQSGSMSGQLVQLAEEGDTADGTRNGRIMARLDDWQEHRPGQIAKRESVQASNAIAREVYKESGVSRLMWVASGSETCPFCTSMDGKVVSIERPFLEAGESVGQDGSFMKPSTSIANPPLHRGCDCNLVAA